MIGYLYGKKSKKLREFEEYVERLREKDKRLGYHLSERGRGRIIFLSDNMNKKIIKKLLGFLRIEKSNEEVIVYFRFVGDKFIGGNYGNMEFDNVLTYWM